MVRHERLGGAMKLTAIAEALLPELRPYLRVFSFGPMVRHPLVYSIVWTPDLAEHANAQYIAKRSQIDRYEEQTEFDKALWLYERPYRLSILWFWWETARLTTDQYRSLLIDAWTDTEMPSSHGTRQIVRMFRAAGFVSDIPADLADDSLVRSLEGATIYRGVGHARYVRGVSWTRDGQRAAWFARRFAKDKRGIVVACEIPARGILGLFNGRGESEVVINPRLAQSIRQIPETTEGEG